MRDKAQLLRKRMTEYGTKKEATEKPKPQPPRSDDGPRVVNDATKNVVDASSVSSDPVIASPPASSSSSERIAKPRRSRMLRTMRALRAFKVHVRKITESKAFLKKNSGTADSSSTDSASSSTPSLGSGLFVRSKRPRRSRTSRAVRGLRAFKVRVQKRAERRAVFKKDSTSTTFEPCVIYPVSGRTPSIPGIKLPFGHRRLTREIKRTPRKSNPWDILLLLDPDHRALVDGVVQQLQLAAIGNTNVCLVAIDIDGYSDGVTPQTDAVYGYLLWNKMVLFFRHEAVYAPKETTELEKGTVGGPARITAAVGNMFSGSQRRSKKLLGSMKGSSEKWMRR